MRTLILSAVLIFNATACTWLYNKNENEKLAGPTPVNQFFDGEILLPDYVHDDTLIVTNAKYLNEAVEAGSAATDEEISYLLRAATVPIRASMQDYQISVYVDTIWVFDNGRILDTMIITKSNDSKLYDIIAKDSQ